DAEPLLGVDRENILFMGQSRGGHLIWELACHNPELGSAWAVHAGGYNGPLPRRCKQPVKFLHAHGTADKIVRFGGMKNVGGGIDMPPLERSLALLRKTNGCDPRGESPTDTTGAFIRYQYSGCARDGALELMLHRGGHNYPRNWFEVAIDWFEAVNSGPGQLPVADPSQRGKSIRFQGTASSGARIGTGSSGTRLNSSGSGSRFKSAPKN
ncbi:MAG: hypothetical protein AAFR17_20810, partial [Pseudomonadota bacterium]